MCMYIYIYIYIVYVYTYIYIYTHIHTCYNVTYHSNMLCSIISYHIISRPDLLPLGHLLVAYVYTYTYTSMHMCVYVYIYIYIHMYTSLSLSLSLHIYIYIHIFIFHVYFRRTHFTRRSLRFPSAAMDIYVYTYTSDLLPLGQLLVAAVADLLQALRGVEHDLRRRIDVCVCVYCVYIYIYICVVLVY